MSSRGISENSSQKPNLEPVFARTTFFNQPVLGSMGVGKPPGSLRVETAFSVDLVPVDPPLNGGSGVVLPQTGYTFFV